MYKKSTNLRLNYSSAKQLLSEWQSGKQKLADFARERGYAPQTLYRWRHRLGILSSEPKSSVTSFVPVTVSSPTSQTASDIRICLPSGVVVEVSPQDFPTIWECIEC